MPLTEKQLKSTIALFSPSGERVVGPVKLSTLFEQRELIHWAEEGGVKFKAVLQMFDVVPMSSVAPPPADGPEPDARFTVAPDPPAKAVLSLRMRVVGISR